jgi:hypothetical protein
MPNFSAIRTNSAKDPARIFCMTLRRWTLDLVTLQKQLVKLPKGSRTILEAAALLDQPFSIPLLIGLGFSADSLDPLFDSGIFREPFVQAGAQKAGTKAVEFGMWVDDREILTTALGDSMTTVPARTNPISISPMGLSSPTAGSYKTPASTATAAPSATICPTA